VQRTSVCASERQSDARQVIKAGNSQPEATGDTIYARRNAFDAVSSSDKPLSFFLHSISGSNNTMHVFKFSLFLQSRNTNSLSFSDSLNESFVKRSSNPFVSRPNYVIQLMGQVRKPAIELNALTSLSSAWINHAANASGG